MNTLRCNRSVKTEEEEEEELNPKTLPLSKLVQLIEPKHISYYLEQVSIFLKNKKKDLWFPLISPNLDAFLVRMIQDSKNLKNLLHVLDDKSRELAVDIIKTLDANRHVFAVVHSYVNSSINKNILVYRKIVETSFLKPSLATNEPVQTEKTCSENIPEKIPEKSPTPEEVLPRKPIDSTRRTVITLPFKLQWINATLRFIKDNSLDCLDYPEMSIEQAEFVYSLIRQNRTENDTDPDIQVYFVPLKQALREFNVNNEFKATFTYLCGDKVRLSLEKMPLNNNKSDSKLKHDPNDVSNPLDLDNLTKAQKVLARKTTMIRLLEPNFIRTALQMILDFIHEDTEASIVFKNANEEQCQFLQSAMAMAKSRKLHGVFDEDSRNLLRKIGKYLSTCQFFDLKIELAKLEKKTMLRTVALIKTPKEEFKSSTFGPRFPTPTGINQYNAQTNETLAPHQYTDDIETEYDYPNSSTIDTEQETKENTEAIIKDEPVDESDSETTFCVAIQNGAIENQAEKTTDADKKPTIDKEKPTAYRNTDTNDLKAIDKKTTEHPTTSKDKKSTVDISKSVTEDKKTTDKKAIVQVNTIDNQAHGSRDQSVGRGLGLRKTRLMEGLSTPLESDVAMRMMRQMGWEGGPLGARGEGLIEPVMPPIHLKSGAGLGHVAPKKEPKPQPRPPQIQPQTSQPQTQQPKPIPSKTVHCHKPPNIRLDLIRHILHLISEEPLERIVVYSTKLVKKEVKFLENTIRVLLRRGALIFNDETMQDVYDRVTAEMISTPELQLGFVVGGDKSSTSIYLSKNGVPQKPKTCQNQPAIEDVVSIASKYISAKFITPEMITILGKQLMPTRTGKCAKFLGYRIIILCTILDLINSKNLERIIKFDNAITCKQVTYIKEVVSSINKRTKCTHISTCFENHLVLEILAALKDMSLTVILGNSNQHITFQKTYIQPRPTKNNLEPTNNNNNNVATKETTEVNKNDKNDPIAKDKDKNDNKTVNNNDVIVISDSDATDSESLKKGGKDKSDTVNTSFESDFESDVKDDEKAVLDGDKEVLNKLKNTDEKVTTNKDDEPADSTGATSKRLRSDSDKSTKNKKKTKKNENVKYLGIAPDGYPMEDVGVDDIITFQNKISEKLDSKIEKPLLECLGIRNGAIIYCCYNELGRFLIESIANEMQMKVINITSLYKNIKPYNVKARINSFVEINLKSLFSRIEDYNVGLKTNLWRVRDMQPGRGHVTISLEIDGNSFDYISESNFSIFAGVDKLRFNVSWD